jgi:hypothetical protein
MTHVPGWLKRGRLSRVARPLLVAALLLGGATPAVAQTAGPAPSQSAAPASSQGEALATAPVTIEGVTLRSVLDSPVPLYVTSSVSDQKVRWMRDAVAVALGEVPRISGLPLPSARLEFYLFNDPAELSSLSGQLLRSPGPRVSPECFALAQASTPRRGIYCQADTWESAPEALDYVSHELTHQVQQGDSSQRRNIAQWFNEGLAEYIQQRVLAEHEPAYAARDRWQREARVASALHNGRLLRLRDLASNANWQRAAGQGWAGQIYSHSSLVVGWLADSYGMNGVIEVVRRSGGPFGFDAVFEEVFGLSVSDAEQRSQRDLEADLLKRYPVGLSVFSGEYAADAVLHVAVVGFQPREWLEKDYRDESGRQAAGRAAASSRPEAQRTDAAGFAMWSWESDGAPPASGPRTVQLTVHGSNGSEATQTAAIAPAR